MNNVTSQRRRKQYTLATKIQVLDSADDLGILPTPTTTYRRKTLTTFIKERDLEISIKKT